MQAQMTAVEKKIANVRAAIEDGVSDLKWASARLEELHEERERLQGQMLNGSCGAARTRPVGPGSLHDKPAAAAGEGDRPGEARTGAPVRGEDGA